MTPKEKAKELVAKFKPYSYSGRDEDREWRFENAKQCALIAVDYIKLFWNENETALNYWNEVKQEIEKL